MLPIQQQVIKFAVSTCVVVEFKKSTESVKIANGLIAVPSTNLIPADSRIPGLNTVSNTEPSSLQPPPTRTPSSHGQSLAGTVYQVKL